MEAAHGGGDAVVGVRTDDADGEAAQSGGVFGAVPGADPAAVLVEGVVENVVHGLDGPVAAVEGEQALGVGGVGGVAGDAVGAFDGGSAGLPETTVRSTRKAWPTRGKVGWPFGRVVVRTARLSMRPWARRGGSRKSGSPRSRKNSSMSSSRVGWLALAVNAKWAPRPRRKSASLRWVGRASAVKGPAGEVDVEVVEHGDDGADLVPTACGRRALGLVVGTDRQAVDFFRVYVVPLRWPTALGMWVRRPFPPSAGPPTASAARAAASSSARTALRMVLASMAMASSSAPWVGVEALQGAVELVGVDAHQHVADDEQAGHLVVAAAAPAAEPLAGTRGQVGGPLGHGLVAARAAQGGAGGDGEHDVQRGGAGPGGGAGSSMSRK